MMKSCGRSWDVYETNVVAEYYYLYNAHGDVVQLVDYYGTVMKRYDYDAFGVEVNPVTSDTNPFRYAGEYYDKETETYYLRARYYSPGLGRFLSEDPIRDGLNWYTYCGGNPVMYADSNGMKAYSVRATGSRNKGKYDLFVSPQSLDASRSAIGLIPVLGWMHSLGTAFGLRLAGYREIDYDLSGVLGFISGGIGYIDNNVLKGISKWSGRGLNVIEGITYAWDWFGTKNYQIEEAVFNHFDHDIWLSDSRDIVDSKFEYAMSSVTWWITQGKVEVKKAVDVFGENAFSDGGGNLGMITWREDPLTGRKKIFKKDEYYFFEIEGTDMHSIISDLEPVYHLFKINAMKARVVICKEV